jgi:hypothetical protein
MQGWPVLVVVMVIMAGVLLWLYGAMVYHIRKERRQAGLKGIWRNFALSIAFSSLFAISWLGQGLVQWQSFSSEQAEHGRPAEVKEFVADFSASTLENWQSEFLQLFSFVVMAALLIHHGSAESRDSEDRIEQALRRIEQKLEGRRPARGSS